MNASLFLLMRLQARAAMRRAFRSARSPKGIIFAIIGVLILIPWLGSAFISARFATPTDPAKVRLYMPLILLLVTGLNLFASGAGDKAISFTPGEVNFLFPGPFTRRQLLFYKLFRTFLGAVGSGLFMSLVLRQHAASWTAGFVACVLALLMVQLLTVVVMLAGQTIGERAFSLARRAALVTLVVVLAMAVVPALKTAAQQGVPTVAEALHHSKPAQAVLSPFVVLANAFTAKAWSELALWAGVAVAMNAALLALIVRLDADYREAALAASQRMRDRLDRIRRGQILSPASNKTRPRRPLRLPMFPWLGGAGPTAWRQFTTALRTARGMLFILLLLAIGFAPVMMGREVRFEAVIGILGWMTVLLGMMLRFDFRAELEQIAWLKALPLHPAATALGQLATPALILTSAQAIVLTTAVYNAPHDQRLIFLAGFAFLLPFNLLMTAVENLLFLLFPSRQIGAAPGDIGQMGRQVVFFLFKLLILFTVCGIAAGIGLSVYAIAGSSIAGVIAASVTLHALAAGAVLVVGMAFRRFDPSLDTPG